LTSAAMTVAVGTIWCNFSISFCTSSMAIGFRRSVVRHGRQRGRARGQKQKSSTVGHGVPLPGLEYSRARYRTRTRNVNADGPQGATPLHPLPLWRRALLHLTARPDTQALSRPRSQAFPVFPATKPMRPSASYRSEGGHAVSFRGCSVLKRSSCD
jgi:hypothetical protein